MKNTPEKQLLVNYLLGICTPKELDQVEQWLDEKLENVQLLKQVLNEINHAHSLSVNKQKVKGKLKEQIDIDLFSSETYQSPSTVSGNDRKKRPIIRNGQWISRVVTMASVVIIAVIFAFHFKSDSINSETVNEVNLQHRTLSYGQTSTFRFSDGSVIILNGGSTLSYPKQFEKEKREVYLDGEAFFDIARDQDRPFIVHTAGTTTKVLGTSFNIKAYQNEPEINVAVVEGKVSVTKINAETLSTDDSQQIILEKNQWATYQNSGELLNQGEGDIWEHIAWKDQILIFNDKPFSEVARTLERWYGVEIILEDDNLKHKELKGEHKNVSLERVLESIQYVLEIEFTINEQVVTIRAADK